MISDPRPSQKKIISYRRGKMGISAVPGAGKTWTLSRLAAELISDGILDPDQEILVVTLVNTAVENFSNRISQFITVHGLLPKMGYRVRTLHGLAHDIVSERPSLVGLDNHFQIIDERESDAIRKDVSSAWMNSHPEFMDEFLSLDLSEKQLKKIQAQDLPIMLVSLANSFIRSAKDLRLKPDDLSKLLSDQPTRLPLAEMGCEIYQNYQRALIYRGAVDFDDLIRFALDLLEKDDQLLERLRYRWPFILEDESQDSSRLQEQILRLLSGPQGNWVRVGDPNQAIFETFTTANPWYLRNFIANEAEFHFDLPESGRSQASIYQMANQLVDWVMADHPLPAVRDALLAPPHIEPVPSNDPQPNPPDDPQGITFLKENMSAAEELATVIDAVEKWLPDHPQKTIAILVPINKRGSEVVEELKKRKVKYLEYLTSTTSTRAAAGALANVLAFLSNPQSSSRLALCYQVWRRAWRDENSDENFLYKQVPQKIKLCKKVETYLSPRGGEDWLETIRQEKLGDANAEASSPNVLDELAIFKDLMTRWQKTTLLPIDQLVLTLAQDLFTEPADLALSFHLANLLRRASNDHSDWRLPELSNELAIIARNERKFQGFDPDMGGFDPNAHRGIVVITTMHKAKGLEWDHVHLMSLNNYDFPSGQPYDSYISEKWFLRSKLNLEAEALAQLNLATKKGEFEWYQEGAATNVARMDYIRERLRLLYVAITRAREELILSWNTGKQGNLKPAIPYVAIKAWWEENHL